MKVSGKAGVVDVVSWKRCAVAGDVGIVEGHTLWLWRGPCTRLCVRMLHNVYLKDGGRPTTGSRFRVVRNLDWTARGRDAEAVLASRSARTPRQ